MYKPGLKIYRRVGEEIFFHPRGVDDDKTVIRLIEADTDGVKIQIISSSGEVDDDQMETGEKLVFGEKSHELVLHLDECMGGHASFRALAGPEVVVRRVVSDERRTK